MGTKSSRKHAGEPPAARGIYPYTPLEEDLLRWQVVRHLIAYRCQTCTKARCRRAQPCRQIKDIDVAIAGAEAAVAEEKRLRALRQPATA